VFLNLASHYGMIACVTEKSIVAQLTLHPKTNDHDLQEAYEQVLRQAQWDAEDITQLACVTGPGGFMSLRMAAAFTNALMFALHIPATGIHLSDLLHAQSFDCHPERGEGWWLHSTKKDLIFIRGFGRFASVKPNAECIPVSDLDTLLHAGDRYAGELLLEHHALIETKGLIDAQMRHMDDVLPAFLHQLHYSDKQIEPWYGRGW